DQINDLQEIDSMLAERVKDWTREWMEQGIQKGIEKGIEQGIEQGELQGERSMLTRQLVRRFGPLDETTRQRLQGASRAELEGWADNILDAKALEEVFILP